MWYVVFLTLDYFDFMNWAKANVRLFSGISLSNAHWASNKPMEILCSECSVKLNIFTAQ